MHYLIYFDMTNVEKAKEIARCLNIATVYPHDYSSAYNGAILMAQWKDEQHEKEKQQLIDKACKEFCNCCAYAYMACRRYNYDNLHCRHYIKFKQAMK